MKCGWSKVHFFVQLYHSILCLVSQRASVDNEPNILLVYFLQSDDEQRLQSRLEKLDTILSGEYTIKLNLQFLIKNNKTDMLILKNTKV